MATSVCPWWASDILKIPLRRIIHNPRKILSLYIATGTTTLDVGCGPGYFSLPMAELVGNNGTVVATDFQPQMLDKLGQAKAYADVKGRIVMHRCEPQSLCLDDWAGKVDTALLMMVLHEIPDKVRVIRELYAALREGGQCLFAEPIIHVNRCNFAESISLFEMAGFHCQPAGKINFCRAAVLVKP